MFIVVLGVVLGLMHLYVWKRLIKDTTAPGVRRQMATLVLVALAVLLVATLILPRVTGTPESPWLAWPG